MNKILLLVVLMTVSFLTWTGPAQASSHRFHLGTTVSATERAQFGCDSTGSHQEAFLIKNPVTKRFAIAVKGTVVHQKRIKDVCQWATPHVVKVVHPSGPSPQGCEWVRDCGDHPKP